MNYRLTMTAAVAVILASFSLITVIQGGGWLFAGAGAVIVVVAAGVATRLPTIPAAAVATALVLIAEIPLLAWPSWPARIAGVALVALVAASAVTRRILPALADIGTYLAALLIYLNLLFASAQSLAGVIPTAASLRHLARLASAGYYEHNYAPPVPGSRGLELIAAAGIGAVAILTDVLAVRLRSPAVAGLPLLVLFAVPVATAARHSGVGLTISFCLGITGYLALLAADGRERLRLWGRLVTVWQDAPDDEHGHGPDTRALAASGRRIGLAAVAVAVVVPLALPGLQRHGLFGGGGGGQGTTLVSPPAPLVQMSHQLLAHTAEPALSYHTNAADPPQQYLQVYVLNYDDASGKWTLTDHSPSTAVGVQPLRAAPGQSTAIATTTDTTKITIDKAGGYSGGMSYLPLPYAPQYVTLPSNGWQETKSTLMVYGYHPDTGLSYSVTSKTAVPTPAQLSSPAPIPADIKHGGYLSYTSPDRATLAGIARQITRRARGRYAQALALEDYFTESGLFTYALRGNLPTSLVQFLTTDRIGYCQQFAFAMAVLARLTGIPSRVAVGYTAGTRAGHGLWKVTTADAHAWPELYFAGTGWIRFEPTPGGPAAQGTATRPVYSTATPGSTTPQQSPPGLPTVLPPVAGGQNALAPKNRKPEAGAGTPAAGHGAARTGGFPVGLLLLAILAALLVAPGLARVVTRRRRWLTAADAAARAHAAWRELTSDLVDHGLGGAASESPRALAARLAGTGTLGGAAEQAAGRIAAAEERARYARTPGPADSLKSDGQLVRRALARNASLAERWRARLLPASALAPVIAAARQAPDVFGWLDLAGLRIRRAVGGAVRARRAD